MRRRCQNERGPARKVHQGVKGGVILGHGAEQKCTSRASMFRENVTQTGRSVEAVNWSECGGVYASAGSLAARTASACRLCLRR